MGASSGGSSLKECSAVSERRDKPTTVSSLRDLAFSLSVLAESTDTAKSITSKISISRYGCGARESRLALCLSGCFPNLSMQQ